MEKPASLSRFVIALLLLPIFTSFLLNFALSTPPSDFGTGSMFDLIATRYDFINHALALNLDSGWRKEMVKYVVSSLPETEETIRILDLATGTADVAILLEKEYSTTKAVNSELRVLGIDPSKNMIEIGREKISSEGLEDQIMLEIGDARSLVGLKENDFHAVTMSFGIRNIVEKEAVLCEIHRVLVKGRQKSKLAILEFSEPTSDFGIMGFLARVFIRYILPVVGAVLSGAPREYMHLQNSIKDFPSPNEFVALIEGVECGKDEKGSFQVENLMQMNFGSVQLYVASPIMRK